MKKRLLFLLIGVSIIMSSLSNVAAQNNDASALSDAQSIRTMVELNVDFDKETNECENCTKNNENQPFYETPEQTKERHDIIKDLRVTSSQSSRSSDSLNKKREESFIMLEVKDNEVIKLDRNKYVDYYDKNGKRFITLKKYQDIIDFSSIDINDSRNDITKLLEESNAAHQKSTDSFIELQNITPEVSPLAGCYNGTGPVGDCEITKYKNERYILERVADGEEWYPSLYCVGPICVPIVTKESMCYVKYDTYSTPYYRCWLNNWCNTINYWGTREKTNTITIRSTTLPCKDLPEANTWQST